MKKINNLKAVVIVHGKSERIIVDYAKSNLRLNIKSYGKENGAKSIQITRLKAVLNNSLFKNKIDFLNYFPTVNLDDFKLFIIMDSDECTEKQFKEYKDKTMFKGHWLYDYIEPIYNFPNLECVLEKSNIPFKNEGVKRKKEYVDLFPIGNDLNVKSDIENLKNVLSKNPNTNMDEFLDFLLEQVDNSFNF